MNGCDQIARGEKSAQFNTSDGKISQEKWDAAFADIAPAKEESETKTSDETSSQQS
jgi:hypothetical protein